VISAATVDRPPPPAGTGEARQWNLPPFGTDNPIESWATVVTSIGFSNGPKDDDVLCDGSHGSAVQLPQR
jgi:hypothetical protein